MVWRFVQVCLKLKRMNDPGRGWQPPASDEALWMILPKDVGSPEIDNLPTLHGVEHDFADPLGGRFL